MSHSASALNLPNYLNVTLIKYWVDLQQPKISLQSTLNQHTTIIMLNTSVLHQERLCSALEHRRAAHFSRCWIPSPTKFNVLQIVNNLQLLALGLVYSSASLRNLLALLSPWFAAMVADFTAAYNASASMTCSSAWEEVHSAHAQIYYAEHYCSIITRYCSDSIGVTAMF